MQWFGAITIGLALLAPAVRADAPGAGGAGRLNVLFIVADDLRPQLGCYGDPTIHSPNIDKLAARGVVFNRAYCQIALCNPSRASVMTGRRPDSTQVFDNGAHFRAALPGVVTLPQLFREAGYHTQGLGKIYHPGCDDAPSWSVPHWDPDKSYYGPMGRAAVQKLIDDAVHAGRDAKSLKPRELLGPAWEIADCPDDDIADGQTADRAVQVLREIKDHPFFLAIGFLKPHLPFAAPRKYWELYPEEQIQLAANPLPPKDAPECALHDWSELRAFQGMPKVGPVSDDQARTLIRGYRACTSYTDANVGRVLDELDRLGLRDRTVVVFWGDHGWQLGEHGLWCKHTNFEIAARAPLIIAAPGKSAGRSTDALVEFVDIYPTIAELCGLTPPPDVEGISLTPLLQKPDQRWKPDAISQFPRKVLRVGRAMGYSVRTDRYRYTRWTVPGTPFLAEELYDHQADPAENTNLAGRADSTTMVHDLAARLPPPPLKPIPAPVPVIKE